MTTLAEIEFKFSRHLEQRWANHASLYIAAMAEWNVPAANIHDKYMRRISRVLSRRYGVVVAVR